MKILFISNYLYLDGPPIALFRIVRELAKISGLEIAVLSYLDGSIKKWYENIGISPIIANCYEPIIENINSLVKTIKEEKPDLVVSNMLDTINGCFAANICNLPSVLYVHEDWPAINFSTLHLFAYKLSDLIVFPSKYQLDVYKPLLDGVKTKVITNGIPLSEFSAASIKQSKEEIKNKYKLPLDKKIVSTIGLVCNRKRQDLFIFAAHEILKLRDDIIFLIVGRYHEDDNYYKLLKKYVQTGGLENKIIFAGEKEAIGEIYHISDLIAHPTSNDVSPLAISEALAFKKPVIATSIDGISELIENGQNGLLIEQNNSQQLKEGIIKIIDNYLFFQNNLERTHKEIQNITTASSDFFDVIKNLKFKKKEFDVKMLKDEIEFTVKKGFSLKFKEITPLIVRKPASKFK
ncbi:hypothetical protein A3J90_00515 [candidate division WOR-1 bacterium RIFOXYC2_FULL_37_10]|nr:MAG: hypothetical protein A2246_06100 [candidate division WOR-1 bacterium RIFOXYA2_FULL_37_7]OGC32612.1 MAG: hypothetical protein A3J90_00515 [candidate division WOR-1 bacterium RIFOXYC2_FULL_37_10]